MPGEQWDPFKQKCLSNSATVRRDIVYSVQVEDLMNSVHLLRSTSTGVGTRLSQLAESGRKGIAHRTDRE